MTLIFHTQATSAAHEHGDHVRLAHAFCASAHIDITEVEERGWQWSMASTGRSAVVTAISYDAAALAAVADLCPRRDWLCEVNNGDTDLGYLQWALNVATSGSLAPGGNHVQH